MKQSMPLGIIKNNRTINQQLVLGVMPTEVESPKWKEAKGALLIQHLPKVTVRMPRGDPVVKRHHRLHTVGEIL